MITKEKIDEDRELAITYLKEMQETYIEGDGYERHPLPEYYAIETALEALKQENCEDCVSREKAIAIGEKLFMLPLETEEDVEDAFEYFKRQIKDLPPVTPTQKKGHWKWEEDWTPSTLVSPAECNYAGWVCSECGEFPNEYTDWDNPDEKPTYEYCPNCGSEMRDKECQ